MLLPHENQEEEQTGISGNPGKITRLGVTSFAVRIEKSIFHGELCCFLTLSLPIHRIRDVV